MRSVKFANDFTERFVIDYSKEKRKKKMYTGKKRAQHHQGSPCEEQR